MSVKRLRHCLPLVAMLASGVASAHPGHSDLSGIVAGLAHPLTGVDHLLAIAAVGIWAALLKGKARWSVPASFAAFMLVGAGMAVAGLALPHVEAGIAMSLLLSGVLIACRAKAAQPAAMAVAGAFAVFHGYAHGAEMPSFSTLLQFGGGFFIATVILLAAGVFLGTLLARRAWRTSLTGAALIASGGWLLAGAL